MVVGAFFFFLSSFFEVNDISWSFFILAAYFLWKQGTHDLTLQSLTLQYVYLPCSARSRRV